MKFALIATFAAVAVAASTVMAADVNVIGANNLRSMDKTAMKMDDATINVMGAQTPRTAMAAKTKMVAVGSSSALNRPTALLNKNTVATDNNVFISRSNIVFTQNDRLRMRQKVQDAIKMKMKSANQDQDAIKMKMKSANQDQDLAKDKDEDQEQAQANMATATLTKNVLRAVSASDKDTAVMTKASAVVAAKDMDASTLAQRIADFVDTVGKREMEEEEQQQREQAIQSQTPRSVVVLIGTKDILRQPTAVVNKNIASSDNQITISRSNVQPSQNDRVVLTAGAKVADAVLPASAINVGDKDKDAMQQPMFRVAIAFRKEGDAMDNDDQKKKQEQFGLLGGAGWGLGWRYPLSYWNTFGAGLYGGGCGLGFPMGGFYYC